MATISLTSSKGKEGKEKISKLSSMLQRFNLTCVRFEILEWLPSYQRNDFIKDAVAGVTLFILMIPQSMSYAILAGMPPIYGLYSSTFPILVYFLLGGSRQLSMGPMAITSLVLSSSCQPYGYAEGSDEYIQLALNISMITGFIMYLVGFFQGGSMVNFLGPSVLTGFLTASATVIFVTQFKYLLGIPLPSSLLYMHEKIIHLLVNLPYTNVYDLVIGSLACIFLYAVKQGRQRYKPTKERMANRWFRILFVLSNAASFVVLIVGGVVSYAFTPLGAISPPFQIVGSLPAGLKAPDFQLYTDFTLILRLIPTGFAIALISFTGNWAVARRYALLYGYEVDANQEMMSAGMSNIIGVLLNSFVVSGGLARSAVVAESGGVTLVSTMIAAVLMIFALLFFTGAFYYIPMCVLAAVINVSILSMMDFQEMVNAYKCDKKDFIVIVCTFLCTFFLGILEGISAGVFIAVAFVLRASAFPEIVTMGRLPGTVHFKNIIENPESRQIPGIAIVHMDFNLYFANCACFKHAVHEAAMGRKHSSNKPIRYVILDVSAWTSLDMSAINTLSDIHAELLTLQIQLAFANAKVSVKEYFRRMHFIEKIGGDRHLFDSIEDAVRAQPSRKMSMAVEMNAMFVHREAVIRNASMAFENVTFSDGTRVLDENIRASVMEKSSSSSISSKLDSLNGRGGSGVGVSSRNTITGNINNTDTNSGNKNNIRSFVSGQNSHTTTSSHLGLETVMSPMAAAAAAAVANTNNSSYYANIEQRSNQNLSGTAIETVSRKGVDETKAGGVVQHPNRRRATSIMDLSRLTSSLDIFNNDGEGDEDEEMGMMTVVQALDDSIGAGDDVLVRCEDSLHSRQPFDQMNPMLVTSTASSGGLDNIDDKAI